MSDGRSAKDPALEDSALKAMRRVLGAVGAVIKRSAESPSFDSDRLDQRDPALIAELLPAIQILNRRYLRLQVQGLDQLHALPRGPALYVANHNSGIMGPDLACTLGTLWSARGTDAPLYALAHDFAMRQFKPLGRLIQHLGAVRASPENALRILTGGAQALVYPGGDLDAYRHTSRRDEIILGQRTGFVRVAQESGAPIVPIVAHGAHRSAYIFTEGEAIARRLGLRRWGRLDRFPLALALPWGVAVGPWLPYLPLPFPVRLRVLPPVYVPRSLDPAAGRELVRTQMQAALDEMARHAAQRGTHAPG